METGSFSRNDAGVKHTCNDTCCPGSIPEVVTATGACSVDHDRVLPAAVQAIPHWQVGRPACTLASRVNEGIETAATSSCKEGWAQKGNGRVGVLYESASHTAFLPHNNFSHVASADGLTGWHQHTLLVSAMIALQSTCTELHMHACSCMKTTGRASVISDMSLWQPMHAWMATLALETEQSQIKFTYSVFGFLFDSP